MSTTIEWTVAISFHNKTINLYTEGAWLFNDEHDSTNSRIFPADALADFENDYLLKKFSKIYEAAEKVLEENGYERVSEWDRLVCKAVQVRVVPERPREQKSVKAAEAVSPGVQSDNADASFSEELKKFVDSSNTEEKVVEALALMFNYSQIDGGHHKLWVIDQVVRTLTGDKYEEFVKFYEHDDVLDEDYDWDTGIAP